jgi:hypothetical protein
VRKTAKGIDKPYPLRYIFRPSLTCLEDGTHHKKQGKRYKGSVYHVGKITIGGDTPLAKIRKTRDRGIHTGCIAVSEPGMHLPDFEKLWKIFN